jgi:hypothetical protein
MHIRSWTKKGDSAKFNYSVSADECESLLEMPDGRNPNQNAWLTITINYTLNFVDRRNLVPGLIVQQNGKFYAKPSLPGANAPNVQIRDWDNESRSAFVKRFAKGEDFWNYRFLLITPQDYDAFDFTSWDGPGWICRPNVICLFRLKSGGSPNHLALNVVRKERDGDFFRSDAHTYANTDVNNKTLWHELGHALDQLHIKALLGDPNCLVDMHASDDPCYDTPAGMEPNIQGRGTGLIPQNAKAWHELIARHTDTLQPRWQVSLATNTPPRKQPIGFNVRGVMPARW